MSATKLSSDDFPDFGLVLRGLGQPLPFAATPFDGNVEKAVTDLFVEIGPLPGFDEVKAAKPKVEDIPADEYHFLIASGLAYTLGGAATVNATGWPGEFADYSRNAHRWAKAYLNARDYAFFNELSLRLASI